MKALGLRPRAFICFSVFGTCDEALALVFDILHEIVDVRKDRSAAENASNGRKFTEQLLTIERNSPLQVPLPPQRPLFRINFVCLQLKSILIKYTKLSQEKNLKTWTKYGYFQAKSWHLEKFNMAATCES